MSGTGSSNRLLSSNVNLLQPGSQAYRLSDALTNQSASLQTSNAITATQISQLQAQVRVLQQFMNSFNYLQAEVSTGTIFLDQRTIYKRSFVINGALNTALNVFTYPHGVTAINYIVSVQAMAGVAGGQQLPITFINMATAPSISLGVSCWCDVTNIYIACGGVTFPTYQVLATLWYTATDR